MLKILNPESLRDTTLLAKTHQLRYKVFVKELGWKKGISAVNQLEFDCYDHADAFYLVDADENDEVNAAVRLTQTVYPNVLLDSFAENVDSACSYRSPDIVEISRFCSDKDKAPKHVMGNIIAGLLQLGLHSHIKQYVSFSNVNIQRRSERFGWPVEYIGPISRIDNARVGAMRHDVTEEYYGQVSRMMALTNPLLDENELSRCPIRQLQIC